MAVYAEDMEDEPFKVDIGGQISRAAYLYDLNDAANAVDAARDTFVVADGESSTRVNFNGKKELAKGLIPNG